MCWQEAAPGARALRAVGPEFCRRRGWRGLPTAVTLAGRVAEEARDLRSRSQPRHLPHLCLQRHSGRRTGRGGEERAGHCLWHLGRQGLWRFGQSRPDDARLRRTRPPRPGAGRAARNPHWRFPGSAISSSPVPARNRAIFPSGWHWAGASRFNPSSASGAAFRKASIPRAWSPASPAARASTCPSAMPSMPSSMAAPAPMPRSPGCSPAGEVRDTLMMKEIHALCPDLHRQARQRCKCA